MPNAFRPSHLSSPTVPQPTHRWAPINQQCLGSGAPIECRAKLLRRRDYRPSGDGWRRSVEFQGCSIRQRRNLGETSGEQPHNNYLGEDWRNLPARLIIALLNIRIILFPGDITTYHFQGWKTTHSSTIRVHFIDCKGVMILLDHRSSWDCVSTHVSDGHIRGCTRSTHNNQ